jgi:hypothetical protein
MKSLSPTARRFIVLALAQQGDRRQQDEWQNWVAGPNDDLPAHLAQVALHALSRMTLRIEALIADGETDSGKAAQLENDLGYIADVEAVLLEHLDQPSRAYG